MTVVSKRGATGVAFGLAAVLALPGVAHAQFTDIMAGLPGVSVSSVAWGDYDNDGDLDILLTGSASGLGAISRVYQNNGGVFTDTMAGLTGVLNGSAAWGDYDGDGDLDILLTGAQVGGSDPNPVSQVYQNNGGVFTDIMAGLTAVSSSAVAWGDYDNDGDLDILLTGNAGTVNDPDPPEPVAQVYQNNGGVYTDIMAGLTGVWGTNSVAWGDYDNDGDLDILLTGNASGLGAISRVYQNNGGVFTDIIASLPGVDRSSVAWGDYDDDGDLDILLTGFASGIGPIAKVYQNNPGASTDIMAGLTGVFYSSAAWGDYDNDGDLDILLTGSMDNSGTERIFRLYQNDGGVFTDVMEVLPGVWQSSVAWDDYDNDGDLDILLTGSSSIGPISQVWRSGCSVGAPIAFSASDGQFPDRVRATWRAVDGAVGYRVFRSDHSNLSNPADISGFITQFSFDDTTAAVPLGMGCLQSVPKTFYYYVVPVNPCGGVGTASTSDSGSASSTSQAGLSTTNAGDFGLLVLTLAAIWAYQRRRKMVRAEPQQS